MPRPRPFGLPALAALLALLAACRSAPVPPPAAPAAAEPAPPAAAAEPAAPPQGEEPFAVAEAPLEPVETPVEAAPIEPPAPSVEAVLAEALAVYESAHELWQEGRFEEAFAALDRAYELMASVEGNGDPLLAQQKEDLRRLISRRIVEIYASQRTVAGDMERSIPLVVNDYVEREIRSFQTSERQQFLEAYQRSGLYRPMILEQLAAAGMPEQLSWLPMVESWFKVRALSSARALGMWQFISSTGYRFGLRRTDWFDERMDPEKSTRAALAYLTELHELFGDWMTALAAYNCGEARVLRLINQQRVAYFDQFWDLYEQLPRETRRYVPRFMATLAILQDPVRYGFHDLPEPLAPPEFDTLETSRSVRLEDLEGRLQVAAGSLTMLNPELRRGATPTEPYVLKVPTGSAETVLAALAQVPRAPVPAVEVATHRVSRGETLSTIAARYRTSVASLMHLNGLRNANRIWPGQLLKVDGTVPASSAPSGEAVRYTVRRGDSLWTIARRFGTTVDRLQRDNGLRSSSLRPGQDLVVRAGSAGGRTYTVRSGDTLSDIARVAGVSPVRLAEANGLSLRSTIFPGQRLVIPAG